MVSPWLLGQVFAHAEAWLVRTLLRSPRFHRSVQAVEKKVREVREGKSFEDMGGTKLDDPNRKNVFDHFLQELKNQAGSGKGKDMK